MPARVPVADVAGRRMLFVMAAEQEYGPHLQARFQPLMTGVGPVEAAVVAATALARLAATADLPDLVVSLGSAGSAVLEQTVVHQATSITYRDMDASALGFAPGVTPFLDLPAEVDPGLRIPGVPGASLSTGADVVVGEGFAAAGTDMVDMETFAVLRACQHVGVPLVALRGISDGAADLRHVDDWTAYLHVVDQHLAEAVDLVADAIADGLLD